MRRFRPLLSAILVLATSPAWAADDIPQVEPAIVAEARAFMSAYADELRTGDRAALGARYHGEGVCFVANGVPDCQSKAAVVSVYATEWRAPAAFEWSDLNYVQTGPDAVTVIGRFLWTRPGQTAPKTFSYHGLLLREDGRLSIRIEDENPLQGMATD